MLTTTALQPDYARRRKHNRLSIVPSVSYPPGGDPLDLTAILNPNFYLNIGISGFNIPDIEKFTFTKLPDGYGAEIVPGSDPTALATAFKLKVFTTANTELPTTIAGGATASGTGTYQVAITNYALTTNVATITAANKFAGTETGVVIAGLTGTGAPLNGTVTITSASPTQFTFALVHADIVSAATVVGTATLTSATISNVAAAAGVATFTVVNQFTVGEVVTVAGLPVPQAAFDGTFTVVTSSGTQFTAAISVAGAYPAALLADSFELEVNVSTFTQ